MSSGLSRLERVAVAFDDVEQRARRRCRRRRRSCPACKPCRGRCRRGRCWRCVAASQTPTTMPMAVNTPCQVISRPPKLVMLGSMADVDRRAEAASCRLAVSCLLRAHSARLSFRGYLPDLSFDGERAATETAERCFARRYLTPEPPSGRVESKRQAKRKYARRDPDERGAEVAAHRDAGEGALAVEFVLVVAHASPSAPAPGPAPGRATGPTVSTAPSGPPTSLRPFAARAPGRFAHDERRDAADTGEAQRKAVEVAPSRPRAALSGSSVEACAVSKTRSCQPLPVWPGPRADPERAAGPGTDTSVPATSPMKSVGTMASSSNVAPDASRTTTRGVWA